MVSGANDVKEAKEKYSNLSNILGAEVSLQEEK
jgi:hypothetical protein